MFGERKAQHQCPYQGGSQQRYASFDRGDTLTQTEQGGIGGSQNLAADGRVRFDGGHQFVEVRFRLSSQFDDPQGNLRQAGQLIRGQHFL